MHNLEEYCSQNPRLSLCVAFGFFLAGSFWQQCHSQHWPPSAGFCQGRICICRLNFDNEEGA